MDTGEVRQIVAWTDKSYTPEELIDKKIAMAVNLRPAKIMGIESLGMLLATDANGTLSVQIPDKDIKEGGEGN